ncbi:TPA: autotransporter outer membrane beta-barrel domain-containing protein, partial [Escherichia coli]|nr:autotransporter outer membrane beta-barrel domain-containing protein [Escherichia coli]
ALYTTIYDGGTQTVSSGGSATSTTISSGGTQTVLADGVATDTTIYDGGSQVVSSGGAATGTTVSSGGILNVRSGGVLYGTTTLTDNGTLTGDVVTNEGELYFLNNSSATFTGTLTGTGSLIQEGGITLFSGLLSQDGGITLTNGATMTMDALNATVDVTAGSGTTLTLDNGTSLTGSVEGSGNMVITGYSVWYLGGDSTVGELTLDSGTVDFRPSITTGLMSTFQPVSLTLGSLSGSGTFRMYTDLASYTGDMLNVTGNASGDFVLDIQNTGQEPTSASELEVVHTGGGDATFTLNGGVVDAGTWQYSLVKEGT